MASTRKLVVSVAVAVVALGTPGVTASSASAEPGTATQISAGGLQACAITPQERLKCWGDNDYGQLGIGANGDDQFKPVLVPNLEGVKRVSVGDYNACAVLTGGKLKCWGYNFYGVVGDGTTDERRQPQQVLGMTSGVAAVSVGTRHACALMKSGKVKCWGANDSGELGNGTSGNQFETPQLVVGIKKATHVSAGRNFSCATVKSKAKCWGYNGDGQLGDDTTDDRDRPTQVFGLDKNVKKVIAGYRHACAIVGDGRLKCWGYNGDGEVGTGETSTTYDRPKQVLGMESGVTRVDADYYFTCAVKNGKARCFGDNNSNQLGDGTTDDRDVPTQVVGLTKHVVDIDISWYSGCALLKSGAAKCWGWNGEGEVGINDTVNDQIPTPRHVLL